MHVTRLDRAQLTTTLVAWRTEPAADNHGRPRPFGHRTHTPQRQTGHADGITCFVSERAADDRAGGASERQWYVPTARSYRTFNQGDDATAPGALSHLMTIGLHVPFSFEHELRARHPKGVAAGLRPNSRYYASDVCAPGQPPHHHAVSGGHRGSGGDLRERGVRNARHGAGRLGVR